MAQLGEGAKLRPNQGQPFRISQPLHRLQCNPLSWKEQTANAVDPANVAFAEDTRDLIPSVGYLTNLQSRELWRLATERGGVAVEDLRSGLS